MTNLPSGGSTEKMRREFEIIARKEKLHLDLCESGEYFNFFTEALYKMYCSGWYVAIASKQAVSKEHDAQVLEDAVKQVRQYRATRDASLGDIDVLHCILHIAAKLRES